MDLDPLVFNVSYRQAIRRILEREQGALSVQSAVELSRIAKGLELWEEQARLPLSASTEVEAKLDDLIRRSEVWLRKTGQTISEAPLSDIRQKFARLAEALALASNVTVADGAVARERTEIARAGAAIEQAARTMSRIPTAGSETRPSRVNADSTELHVLSRLEILARQRTGNDSLKIESVESFYTQSSKDVFLVRTNAAGGWPQEAILRISPVFSIVETNLADEYGMLQIVHCAGLRVPRPLLGEGDPDRLGGQFVMMERVDGHVIRALDDPECAIGILKESARFLAQLHRIDPMLLFTARNQPHAPLRQLVEHRISDLRKRWDRDRLGSSSIIAAAFIWLFDHVQQLSEDPVLVHGDFDLRNILVKHGQLSAVVDWEMGRVGHRAEDLGYIKQDVTKVMPWNDYLDIYLRESAATVSDFEVKFFDVLAWTWRLVVVETCHAGYRRGEHDDFLYITTRVVEYDDHLDHLVTALS